MIIRPPKLQRVQGGLLKRGLPAYVLRHPGVDITKLIKAIPTKHGQISAKEQFEALKDIASDPLGHPYLYAINGDRIGDNAACIAAALAGYAAKNHRLPFARFPWWHRTQGTGHDVLLEPDLQNFSFGNPSMLIFDGLIEDSNMLKLERTRDLLQIYSHVPRLLVLSGCANPIAFVQDRLKMVATRYLHLTDRNVFIQI